jgi:hypothetical protein
LTSEAEGAVQSETDQLLLDRLLEKAQVTVEILPADGIAIVENEGAGISQSHARRSVT